MAALQSTKNNGSMRSTYRTDRKCTRLIILEIETPLEEQLKTMVKACRMQ